MKKILLSVAAISGLMFASCTNEADQISEAQKEQNAIGFSTYSMLSKGNPVESNDAFAKNGSSFEVVGFLDAPAGQYMKAQISHDGTSWGYANPLEKAYWPKSGNLNFYAITPYTDFYPVKSGNKITYASGSATVNYTIPTKTSEQQDLMYAFTAPLSKPASGGNVTLPFKHALNQVHFKAKTESNNLFVDIDANGIQLCNLKNTGTFSFGAASSSWSATSGKVAFTATSNLVTDIKSTGLTTISSTSDVLMLMPQAVTAWVPAAAPNNATGIDQAGAYLKINCRLYTKVGDQKVYYHGDDKGFAFMFIPFPGTGMDGQGKKITYTLIFGGGYTDPGEPILTPITFDTTVENWDDVNNDFDINTQEPVTPPSVS